MLPESKLETPTALTGDAVEHSRVNTSQIEHAQAKYHQAEHAQEKSWQRAGSYR
jgi:hypothetical protein